MFQPKILLEKFLENTFFNYEHSYFEYLKTYLDIDILWHINWNFQYSEINIKRIMV